MYLGEHKRKSLRGLGAYGGAPTLVPGIFATGYKAMSRTGGDFIFKPILAPFTGADITPYYLKKPAATALARQPLQIIPVEAPSANFTFDSTPIAADAVLANLNVIPPEVSGTFGIASLPFYIVTGYEFAPTGNPKLDAAAQWMLAVNSQNMWPSPSEYAYFVNNGVPDPAFVAKLQYLNSHGADITGGGFFGNDALGIIGKIIAAAAAVASAAASWAVLAPSSTATATASVAEQAASTASEIAPVSEAAAPLETVVTAPLETVAAPIAVPLAPVDALAPSTLLTQAESITLNIAKSVATSQAIKAIQQEITPAPKPSPVVLPQAVISPYYEIMGWAPPQNLTTPPPATQNDFILPLGLLALLLFL